MNELALLDARTLLMSHDCDTLPEPYEFGDEEEIDPRNLTPVWPRGIGRFNLAPLPDLYPGRAYYVANSLEAELRDYNTIEPKRSKASDGWLGNASHQATRSDHNPDYRAGGIIRAGDLTTSSHGIAGLRTTEAQREWHKLLIADLIATEKANPVDRIWYLIHYLPGDSYPKIWSRTNDWAPKRYYGASPHDHHWHTSIMRTNAAAGDTKRWFTKLLKVIEAEDPAPNVDRAHQVSLASVRKFFTEANGDEHEDTKNIQRELNAKLKPAPGLDVDGRVSRNGETLKAFGAWQYSLGYRGDEADGVPGPNSLTRLGLTVTP